MIGFIKLMISDIKVFLVLWVFIILMSVITLILDLVIDGD